MDGDGKIFVKAMMIVAELFLGVTVAAMFSPPAGIILFVLLVLITIGL